MQRHGSFSQAEYAGRRSDDALGLPGLRKRRERERHDLDFHQRSLSSAAFSRTRLDHQPTTALLSVSLAPLRR